VPIWTKPAMCSWAESPSRSSTWRS
jgi:hypothetical protein